MECARITQTPCNKLKKAAPRLPTSSAPRRKSKWPEKASGRKERAREHILSARRDAMSGVLPKQMVARTSLQSLLDDACNRTGQTEKLRGKPTHATYHKARTRSTRRGEFPGVTFGSRLVQDNVPLGAVCLNCM